MKYFALLGALLVALGCGSKDHATAYVPPGGGGSGGRPSSSHAGAGGKTGTSGTGGDTSGSGEAGEAGTDSVNPLAPLIIITSPTEVTDPNKGPVVLDKVRVLCTAIKSGT